MEGLQQEGRHLRPRHGVVGAVVPTAASAGDAFEVELLDPVGEEARARDVGEEARAGRGDECRAVLGLQQEDGHLRPRHRAIRAVNAGAAAGRDSVVEDVLDEPVELLRGGHVREAFADVKRPALRRAAETQPLVEGRVPVRHGTRTGDAHLVTVVRRRRGVAVRRRARSGRTVVRGGVRDAIRGPRRSRDVGSGAGEGQSDAGGVLPGGLDHDRFARLEHAVQVRHRAGAVHIRRERR